jgi:hypothetical protein
MSEKEAKTRKPRGNALKRRAPKSKPEVGETVEVPTVAPSQQVVNIDVSKEQHLAETILDARGYTDEELDTIIMGIENQEANYDWLDNMNEFKLPKPLQELEDSGEQNFRWVDSSDQQCMIQLSRENFRWTPVNMLSHGKYFKKPEDKVRFNRHGGIMNGYMLLCWMPGKLHRAWQAQKARMSGHETPMERPSQLSGVHHYDPVKEGTATSGIDSGGEPLYASERRFTGVVHDANDEHPDTSYEESGEYTD